VLRLVVVALLIVIFIALGVTVAWWLSGYDPKVTGENSWNDYIRRTLRLLITAFLVAILFGLRPSGNGYGFAPILMIAPISIALIWCGCIAEWWSHSLHHMFFHGGEGEYDPRAGDRHLDHVASLLRIGRHEEALVLAEKLMESGDANVVVLETLLVRAGLEWKAPKPGNPLAEVYRLRSQGNPAEAVKILDTFVEKNPSNVQALLLLIRINAEDLKQPDRATEVLHLLEKQPRIPVWQRDYARRSLQDWSQPKPPPLPPVPLPESIDELFKQGYAGTAIEVLDQKLKETPGDFDLWLKLLEARTLHLKDPLTAQKLLQKMERDRTFTDEQIQTAKAKLTEWRAAKPQKA
jgi:tetratricopeptide (TPR) repeat protein